MSEFGKWWVVPSLVAALTGLATAQVVLEESGNIIFTDVGGHTIQLTSSGKDSQPSLSLDQKSVAFVREVIGPKMMTATEDVAPNEIWIVGSNGHDARRVVRSQDSAGKQGTLAGLARPQFSIDGRLVFFESGCSVSSSCISSIDLKSGALREVTSGNDFQVVTKGPYRGDLLLSQHRHFLIGGSYDFYFLFTPEGKPIEGAVAGDGDPASVLQEVEESS